MVAWLFSGLIPERKSNPDEPFSCHFALSGSHTRTVNPGPGQRAAHALGLTPPRTIARVAQALEQLMEEDVAAGRPMIAALVISRRGEDLPASGFFEKAVALGRFPSAPAQHSARYAEEREQALRAR